MARVLIPGVLVGVAIALIANIVIGGIAYVLFDGSNVATLTGTLTASVVGAVFGALAIYTATRKDASIIIRGVAAGAFIGVVGGFLGAIDTYHLKGIAGNVELISAVVGAIVGAAGFKGAGARFFDTRIDKNAEDMGAPGRPLDGALSGIIIGVVCGIPVALFTGGSIYIFLRKIDPTENMDKANRVEFVNVLSLDELLLGAIVGIIVGTIVGFVLSRKRVDGLLSGMLVGIVVGLAWALPEIIVTTFNPSSGGPLGSELLFGALAIAAVTGAVFGVILPEFRATTPWRLALIGVAIGVVFLLPHVMITGAYILNDMVVLSSRSVERSPLQTFLVWNRSVPVHLLINVISGASVCLIIGAFMRRYAGVTLSGLVVTVILIAATLGLKGRYFLLLADLYLLGPSIGMPSFVYGFSRELIANPIHLAINVLSGSLAGIVIGVVMKLTTTRPNPDKIPSV